MGVWENALENTVKGALVLLGIVLALTLIGLAALIALPFIIGYAIALFAWWLYDRIYYRLYPHKLNELDHVGYLTAEQLRESQRNRRQKELAEERERKRLEEQRVPETAPDDEWGAPVEKEYDISGNLHLNSSLTHRQQEKLYAQGYNVLKISPFGTSGAAIYWINTRHNESKEHAFFCYILEIELKKYVDEVEMNVTNGPDLVVEWKGKRFCFDVETGKSLSRHPEWLGKKFAYYQREYDKSFILVTKRTLQYKYSKYGIVITRGKIKETIRKLFRSRQARR